MPRATDEDVYYAYRLILRREPDPGGLEDYRQRVRRGLSVDDLVLSFVSSDEYHDRLENETLGNRTAVELGGYQVIVDRKDLDFGEHLVHWREYEEHVRKALRAHLRPGDVCVDVGANVGVMTFLAASIVGRDGRVIAVEPNTGNLQLLYRGLLLNKFTTVEVLPLAASSGRRVFSLTGGSNTELAGARPIETAGEFVQSVALDEALGDLARLDVVKMDIEGHEPVALQGFWRNITRHRPVLVVEFNPLCLGRQQQDPAAYARQLLGLYPRLRVISAFGDDATFDRAEELMTFWQRRAHEVAATGVLPEGHLHFDVIATRDA